MNIPEEKNIPVQENLASEHNATFWFHVLVTVLGWIGPFLFSWYILVPIYLLVLIQFVIFGRCLMNGQHGLDDSDATFYSYLLEKGNIHLNRKQLKLFVRRYLYIILSAITLIWQVVLGFDPLLF
ncbi:MAG: hypothetical protein R2879_04815 [Saprospiraceae bacterium]